MVRNLRNSTEGGAGGRSYGLFRDFLDHAEYLGRLSVWVPSWGEVCGNGEGSLEHKSRGVSLLRMSRIFKGELQS